MKEKNLSEVLATKVRDFKRTELIIA